MIRTIKTLKRFYFFRSIAGKFSENCQLRKEGKKHFCLFARDINFHFRFKFLPKPKSDIVDGNYENCATENVNVFFFIIFGC